jgi:hypothetical protein
VNLSILGNVLGSPGFSLMNSYLNIGIYDHKSISKILIYMLPEILIILLCSLNEIKLRLLGLYYNIEDDLESIEDGVQRNILKGDDVAVKAQKKLRSNMIMSVFFSSAKEQFEDQEI